MTKSLPNSYSEKINHFVPWYVCSITWLVSILLATIILIGYIAVIMSLIN